MLPHPLLEQLTRLKLDGMKTALSEQLNLLDIDTLSFEERLGLLLDREMTLRHHRRTSERLRKAKLKHMACMEDIDFKSSRGLNKRLILSFADCAWVKQHLNVLLVGATGTGKTYLACALAHKACLEGYSAAYVRLPRLFQDLLAAKGDGRYSRLMLQLSKLDVLILDDWGLASFTTEQCRDLLEILDDRHKVRSTIVTSQFPIKHWHETLGEPTLADAILDRLVHNAHKLELKGDSLRKKSAVELPKELELESTLNS
jgi:DNA replication protein DnaC